MGEAKSLPPLEPAAEISLRHDNLCLAAEDLIGKGRARVTIEAAGEMLLTLSGGKKRWPVLKFKGKEKVLVLNRTNIYTLKMRLGFGPKASTWVGRDVWIEADLIRDAKGNPVVKFNRTHGVRIVAELPPARERSQPSGEG